MIRACALHVLVVLVALLPGAMAQVPDDHYWIVWDERSLDRVHVEASVQLTHGSLHMFPGLNAWFEEPRGFASFVENLEIADAQGRPLAVTPQEGSNWHVEGSPSGPVTLRYDVDLSYAGRTFATGNEQIALRDGRALFLTGFALFVMGDSDGPYSISIDAPEHWTILTAWERTAPGRYRARDRNALMRNILTVGEDYGSEVLTRHGIELRIALLGDHARHLERYREVFLPVMEYFVDIFGPEEDGAFMFAILPGANDGEGYMSSFASSQPAGSIDDAPMVWANSLAHEFFHHWNGSRITSLWEHYPERQWFSEGFTEYYANKALLATGVIDADRYDEILGQYLSFHLFFAQSSLYADVTMREAGRRKGTNRPGVYDSGVAAAFCLDGMIREASGQARTLDDFMRAMDSQYGQTHTPIVFEDIVTTASQVAGLDLSGFFALHVQSREPLPIEACARRMGYRASVDGYHAYLDREE